MSDFSIVSTSPLPDVEIIRDDALMNEFDRVRDLLGKISPPALVAQFFLPNGWGVSLVRSAFSYSGEDTAELAVCRRTPDGPEAWELDFRSGFATDVLGWQTPSDLVDLLVKLNTLPTAVDAPVSPYAECGCISPCPDHSPAAVGQADRNFWDDRYDNFGDGDNDE